MSSKPRGGLAANSLLSDSPRARFSVAASQELQSGCDTGFRARLSDSSLTEQELAFGRHSSLEVFQDEQKRVIYVDVIDRLGAQTRICFTDGGLLGEGTFGRVIKGSLRADTREFDIAVKTLEVDRRYKHRELHFLRVLDHPNIISLMYYFLSPAFDQAGRPIPDEGTIVNLNLITPYLPETLFDVIHRYHKAKGPVPHSLAKILAFHLIRGLSYLHSFNIAHRDIKPHNILVNEATGDLKICDLGSMKIMEPGVTNVSYICSRFFRAPELLLGVQTYTVAVDIWSVGCVIAEMYLQKPLFAGKNVHDQLARVMKVIGSPTAEHLREMAEDLGRPDLMEQECSFMAPRPLRAVLPTHAPLEACNLVSRLLQYAPRRRRSMADALEDPWFSDIVIVQSASGVGKARFNSTV